MKHPIRRASTLTLVVIIIGLITALVGVGPAHAASSPLLDAQELRSDVSALTNDYIDRYQDRLTPEQERQLTRAARQARREMTTLVRVIKKAERRDTPAAWTAAYRQHQRAAAMVDGRFDDVRATLEWELTFVERLSAFSDYSSSMRDFQSLGVELARRAGQ